MFWHDDVFRSLFAERGDLTPPVCNPTRSVCEVACVCEAVCVRRCVCWVLFTESQPHRLNGARCAVPRDSLRTCSSQACLWKAAVQRDPGYFKSTTGKISSCVSRKPCSHELNQVITLEVERRTSHTTSQQDQGVSFSGPDNWLDQQLAGSSTGQEPKHLDILSIMGMLGSQLYGF